MKLGTTTNLLSSSGEGIKVGDLLKIELKKKSGLIMHYHLAYGIVVDDESGPWLKRLDAYQECFGLPLTFRSKPMFLLEEFLIERIGAIKSGLDIENLEIEYKDESIWKYFSGMNIYPEISNPETCQ